MQHISTFILPALESTMRQDTICNFIEDLRAAKGLSALPPALLEAAGFAWDITLSRIPQDYLAARDENSLFVEAAKRGYTEAAQVWAMWDATVGAEERLQAEREADAQREAQYAAQPEAIGPGRRAMLEYLAEKGYTEEMLAEMAARP